MNFNNFTIKAQEVVQKAVQLTRAGGNQAVEPEHLLTAVITEGDELVRAYAYCNLHGLWADR